MMHTMKRHKSVEGAKILLVMSQRVQRPSCRDIEAKQRTGWQQKYVLLILPAHVTRFSEWFCKSSKNSPLQTKREQMLGRNVEQLLLLWRLKLFSEGMPPMQWVGRTTPLIWPNQFANNFSLCFAFKKRVFDDWLMMIMETTMSTHDDLISNA